MVPARAQQRRQNLVAVVGARKGNVKRLAGALRTEKHQSLTSVRPTLDTITDTEEDR